MKQKIDSIVLFSGGVDSAVCLAMEQAEGRECLALTYEYGQRHWVEISVAQRLARRMKAKHEIEHLGAKGMGLRGVGKRGGDGLRTGTSAVVPGRNLLFLAAAVPWAEETGADRIVIGATREDFADFPDCRRGFFDNANAAISTSIERWVYVATPLIMMNKHAVKAKAEELGVPMERTWSCYCPQFPKGTKAYAVPCNVCHSCRGRIAAGIPDAGKAVRT